MATFKPISPHATVNDGKGRTGKRPEAPYSVAPSQDEEKRLNFKVVELLEDAEKVMNLEVSATTQKWVGIGRLMKRIQNAFPYLINEDTSLMLPHKKKRGSRTIEVEGPLTYSLFMDDLESETEMDKYHEHIADHLGPVGEGDHQRETFWAEDVLMMLYSALKYELKRHEDDLDLLTNEDEAETPADNVVPMPHFGMENSDRAQQRWEASYEALANEGYLRRNEVDYHGWVYICCGQQTPPNGPIVWHGSIASLAHLVRRHFNGKWDKATKIFCLEEGKTFPVSFNTTHKPVDDVAKTIDQAFQTAKSH